MSQMSSLLLTFIFAVQIAILPQARAEQISQEKQLPPATLKERFLAFSKLPDFNSLINNAKLGFSREDSEFIQAEVEKLGIRGDAPLGFLVEGDELRFVGEKLKTQLDFKGEKLFSNGNLIRWTQGQSFETNLERIKLLMYQAKYKLKDSVTSLTLPADNKQSALFIGGVSIVLLIVLGLASSAFLPVLGLSAGALLAAALVIGLLYFAFSSSSANATESQIQKMTKSFCDDPQKHLESSRLTKDQKSLLNSNKKTICENKQFVTKIFSSQKSQAPSNSGPRNLPGAVR